MCEVADRYCSDCAWPYECAAAGSCHRRDMGEVRGEDLTRSSDCSPLSSGARCARPDAAAPSRSLVEGGESLAPSAAQTVDPSRARASLRLQLKQGVITPEEYGARVAETFQVKA